MVRAPDGSCSSSTMHSSATAPSSDMMPSFVTAGDLWKRCKLGCYGRSSMVKRRRTEILPIKDFVPIVADGAMAGPVAEGANIPLVILDTSKRPDIAEAIRVHAYLPPGDVASSWGESRATPTMCSWCSTSSGQSRQEQSYASVSQTRESSLKRRSPPKRCTSKPASQVIG